jgi:hypothetical protein
VAPDMIIMKLTFNQPSALRRGMKTDPIQKEIMKKMEIRAIQY